MMTKEDVAQVIAYCDENKISYRQRLSELGISPWSFYDAKRKYVLKEEGENKRKALCELLPDNWAKQNNQNQLDPTLANFNKLPPT